MKVYVTLEGDSGLKLYIFASPSKFSELRVCVDFLVFYILPSLTQNMNVFEK